MPDEPHFEKSPMNPAEKVGRVAWIGFIVFSAPCAFFCAAMVVIALAMLFVGEWDPIESPPPSTLEQFVAWICGVIHPVFWTASIFFAHRFNGGWRAVWPFALNLLPVLGLLWIAHIISSDEPQDFGWPVWYLGTIAAMLIVGLMAAILSSLSRPIFSTVSHG